MNNFQKIKAMNIDEMAEWLILCQIDFARNVLNDLNLASSCDYRAIDNAVEINKQWLESEGE